MSERYGWKIITRQAHEQILLSGGIIITVLKVHGDQVTLRVDAPHEVAIQRAELWDRRHVPRRTGEEGSR